MNRLIRRYTVVLFCTIVFITGSKIFSQPNYIMSLTNGETVNDSIIEFDVYIKSIGSNFTLTSYQCVLSFDQFIINNGNLTFTYIPGTSQLLTLIPANAIGIFNNYGVYFLTFASLPPGEEIITPINKKVGRFRLLNTNSFLGNGINIRWLFNSNVQTIITGTGYADITNNFNHINLLTATTFPLTVLIKDKWNLVSVPGLHPDNQNVYTWWLRKDPAANIFRFSGNYQAITTVQPGEGYWMNHIGDEEYSTGNQWPADGILYASYNPIIGNAGWNLIGGYDYSAPVTSITTIPAGLQIGFIFGYSPVSGYYIANELLPGYGYWITLTGEGLINIPDPPLNWTYKAVEYCNEDWGKIIITDNGGKSSILYAVNENLNLSSGQTSLDNYQLPPAPHAGIFDVRYASGSFAEDLRTGIHTIEMRGIEYPVKVRVENMNIQLQDEAGKTVNTKLKSGEEITVNNNLINKLLVSADIIPDLYLLEQNYPNPFNPVTTIEFSIPGDVKNVRLTIYNLLGQKITDLVNSRLEAGRYSYQWNAKNVVSGLYIYELRTDNYFSVKKMMLIK